MLEHSDINVICERFQSDESIEVTTDARTLITNLINCVESDPHETWPCEEQVLERYYDGCKERLPSILSRIKREHRLTERMTTIDIVHWTGRNLKESLDWNICPFPKRVPVMLFPLRIEAVSEQDQEQDQEQE